MHSQRLVALVGCAAILVGACASSASPAPSTADSAAPSSGAATAAPSPSAPSLAGEKITVFTIHDTQFDYYADQIKQFTADTGIEVDYQQAPEDGYVDQLLVKMGAKDDTFDVFFYNNRKTRELNALNPMEPLDAYLANTALTPADYDYADIAPSFQDICTVDGKTYCASILGAGILLMYNKDHFAEAGIGAPPATTDELVTDALKLKTADHAGFCMRAAAGPNVFPFSRWWGQYSKYFDNQRGLWFNEDWVPQINTPETIAAVKSYVEALSKGGPKGIEAYGFDTCLADFQQGKLSMWLDDGVFVSDLENPDASKVVGKVGYAAMECAPVNPDNCVTSAPWAGFINGSSKHKDAAWVFLNYFTSPKMQQQIVDAGKLAAPARLSIYESASMKESLPADFLPAFSYGLAHANGAYKVLIEQEGEVSTIMGEALSKALSGQATVEDALAEAQTKIETVVRDAGLLK